MTATDCDPTCAADAPAADAPVTLTAILDPAAASPADPPTAPTAPTQPLAIAACPTPDQPTADDYRAYEGELPEVVRRLLLREGGWQTRERVYALLLEAGWLPRWAVAAQAAIEQAAHPNREMPREGIAQRRIVTRALRSLVANHRVELPPALSAAGKWNVATPFRAITPAELDAREAARVAASRVSGPTPPKPRRRGRVVAKDQASVATADALPAEVVRMATEVAAEVTRLTRAVAVLTRRLDDQDQQQAAFRRRLAAVEAGQHDPSVVAANAAEAGSAD